MKLYFFLLCFFCFKSLLGQDHFNQKIFDSIEKDTWSSIYNDPEKTLKNSLKLFEYNNNKPENYVKSSKLIAISYMLLGKSDSSQVYFKNAIKRSKLLNDPKYFIDSVIAYFNLEINNPDLSNITKLLYEVLFISKQYPDRFELERAKIETFLGDVYYNNKEYKKAKHLYSKVSNSKDSLIKSNAYRALEGVCFKLKKYNLGLFYAHESLRYIPDTNIINKAITYKRIGRNYLFINQIDLASDYLKKSLKLQNQINFHAIKGKTNYYLGLVARKKKSLNELKYLNIAETETKKVGNIEYLMNTYLKKSYYYSRMNDLKKEGYYYNLYSSLQDSLYNSEQNKIKIELDTKYDIQAKEQALRFKDSLIHKERTLNKFLILAFITISIAIGIVFYFFTEKNKMKKLLYDEKLNSLLNEQMNEIIKAKLEAKNAERKKIGMQLHDGLANLLCSLKMELTKIESNTSIYEITNVIDHIYDEMRSLSHNLIPNYITKVEFSDLTLLIENKLKSAGIRSQFAFNKKEKINSINQKILLQIYRILQECCSNVILHSNASQVWVSFILYTGELHVSIEDNGVGIKKLRKNNNGIGIRNIKDRINSVQGNIKLFSCSDKGCQISFTIPLKNKKYHNAFKKGVTKTETPVFLN